MGFVTAIYWQGEVNIASYASIQLVCLRLTRHGRVIHLSKLRSVTHHDVGKFFHNNDSQLVPHTDIEMCQQAVDLLNDQRAEQQGLAPYARMEYGRLVQ